MTTPSKVEPSAPVDAELIDDDDLPDELEEAVDLLESAGGFIEQVIETRPDWADEIPGLDNCLLDIKNFLIDYYGELEDDSEGAVA